jgi:hypothetical protein
MSHLLLRRSPIVVAIVLAIFLHPASAQEVGTIAALEGSVEIGRAGAWTPAGVGQAVEQGDELRTGTDARVRIVFQDDSVLTVTDNSHLTLDEQIFDPGAGEVKSLIGLLQGKVRALVGDYYKLPGAGYEIESPTAVAGVRGTEFVVTYDPVTELTEVITISGIVSAHSLIDPTGPGVLVTVGEVTTIASGELPDEPRKLDDTIFRQRLEGMDFVGAIRHGFSGTHSLAAGAAAAVPQVDTAALSAAGPAAAALGGAPSQGPETIGKQDAGTLVGQPPAVVKAVQSTGSLPIDIGKR